MLRAAVVGPDTVRLAAAPCEAGAVAVSAARDAVEVAPVRTAAGSRDDGPADASVSAARDAAAPGPVAALALAGALSQPAATPARVATAHRTFASTPSPSDASAPSAASATSASTITISVVLAPAESQRSDVDVRPRVTGGITVVRSSSRAKRRASAPPANALQLAGVISANKSSGYSRCRVGRHRARPSSAGRHRGRRSEVSYPCAVTLLRDRDVKGTWSESSATAPMKGGIEPLAVRQFVLVGVEGPLVGRTWTSTGDACAIGSHPSNDVVLDDRTVSRFHCELHMKTAGLLIRDLGSRNGTFVDGVRVVEAFVRSGSLLRLGDSAVRLEVGAASNALPLSTRTDFGSLIGRSTPMRAAFAVLERAARTDSTVLVEGETGTGKGAAAEGIHQESERHDGPFVVVDCSAIAQTLLETELFGHERGAFTGAIADRAGAFEEANGGTVFLDEVGELPLELQPKLLRVLESREVRRVGSNLVRRVDVRIVAATNRDLRAEVNAGRFRPDLFFRLAVIRVVMPPLRQCFEDLPLLTERLVRGLGGDPDSARAILTPELLSGLEHWSWPGNVRELRNYVERCLLFHEALPVHPSQTVSEAEPPVDDSLPYVEARRKALDAFERKYVLALVKKHGGSVAEAAKAAEINRVSFYRLLRRHRQKR